MKPLALAKTPRLNFAERRRLILETAASLFAERGFEGTTTRAIALECGINEALIFRHFKTKEELYTSLLEQKLEDFAEKIGPALRKILKFPLKPGLLEIANLVVRKHQEDTSCFRMMLYAALESHHLGELFIKQRLPVSEFLLEFFSEKIKTGEMRALDPTVLTRSFLAMISHYVLITQVFHAPTHFPLPERKMLESFVDIFTEGVLP